MLPSFSSLSLSSLSDALPKTKAGVRAGNEKATEAARRTGTVAGNRRVYGPGQPANSDSNDEPDPAAADIQDMQMSWGLDTPEGARPSSEMQNNDGVWFPAVERAIQNDPFFLSEVSNDERWESIVAKAALGVPDPLWDQHVDLFPDASKRARALFFSRWIGLGLEEYETWEFWAMGEAVEERDETALQWIRAHPSLRDDPNGRQPGYYLDLFLAQEQEEEERAEEEERQFQRAIENAMEEVENEAEDEDGKREMLRRLREDFPDWIPSSSDEDMDIAAIAALGRISKARIEAAALRRKSKRSV